MQQKKWIALIACFVLISGTLAFPSLAVAQQSRVNDKDMAALLRNLRDDSKSFQPVFNDAVKRSLIRKTSREKDAKNLVSSFVRQTDGALNAFKRRKTTDNTLPVVLGTGVQINRLVYDLNLDRRATERWEKIRAELHQLALAAGLQDPI